MIVKVKRLHPDAVVPRYATPGAAGFDLVAVEDVIIEPGETKLVPTGLAFEIPEGYELQIRMRSGIAKKTKLRMPNGMGTVDSDYRGEVFVMLENTGDFVYDDDGWEKVDYYFLTVAGERVPDENYKVYHEGAYVVRKGDRIAQGVIAPVMRAVFEEADDLSETDRGSGGFGSTGVRG